MYKERLGSLGIFKRKGLCNNKEGAVATQRREGPPF